MVKKKKLGIKEILQDFFGENSQESIDTLESQLLEFYSNVKTSPDEDIQHNNFEITEFVISKYSDTKNSKSEDIDYLINAISDIEKRVENDKLKIKIEKLLDHIRLEQIRLNYLDEKSKLVNEDINKRILELNEVSDNIKKDIKNNKFDAIAITTLVFTAFTLVSSNVSIISAIINTKVIYSLKQILMTVGMANIMILLSVYLIYSMIRKIHGNISNKELSLVGCIIVFIYLVLLYFTNRIF